MSVVVEHTVTLNSQAMSRILPYGQITCIFAIVNLLFGINNIINGQNYV